MLAAAARLRVSISAGGTPISDVVVPRTPPRKPAATGAASPCSRGGRRSAYASAAAAAMITIPTASLTACASTAAIVRAPTQRPGAAPATRSATLRRSIDDRRRYATEIRVANEISRFTVTTNGSENPVSRSAGVASSPKPKPDVPASNAIAAATNPPTMSTARDHAAGARVSCGRGSAPLAQVRDGAGAESEVRLEVEGAVGPVDEEAPRHHGDVGDAADGVREQGIRMGRVDRPGEPVEPVSDRAEQDVGQRVRSAVALGAADSLDLGGCGVRRHLIEALADHLTAL